MAIAYGQQTKTFVVERNTWQVQMALPKGGTPAIEIFRSDDEIFEDGSFTSKQSFTPIRLAPQDLPSLAPFVVVPSELESLLPDQAAIEQILSLLLPLIKIACDAADAQDLAEKGDPRLTILQPNYFGFYSGLLSEAMLHGFNGGDSIWAVAGISGGDF